GLLPWRERFADLGEQLVDGGALGEPARELRQLVKLPGFRRELLRVVVAELEALGVERVLDVRRRAREQRFARGEAGRLGQPAFLLLASRFGDAIARVFDGNLHGTVRAAARALERILEIALARVARGGADDAHARRQESVHDAVTARRSACGD